MSCSDPPTFSVVVPTAGTRQSLAGCIAAISALDYPPERFEIVVVDDGGDSTSLLEAADDRVSIKHLRQPRGGPARARDAGAARAEGEFLAFTDDDCRPTRDWLAAFARRFGDRKDRVLGGSTHNALTNNAFAATSQLLIDALYAFYNRDPEDARFFTSNNLAVPRSVFGALGGFDESFPLAAAEDREFSDRCVNQGVALTWVTDAIVLHAHGLSARSFVRQHFNYGRGAARLRRLRRARGARWSGLDAGLYPVLARTALSADGGLHRFAIPGLMLTTQIANVAGYAFEELSRG